MIYTYAQVNRDSINMIVNICNFFILILCVALRLKAREYNSDKYRKQKLLLSTDTVVQNEYRVGLKHQQISLLLTSHIKVRMSEFIDRHSVKFYMQQAQM